MTTDLTHFSTQFGLAAPKFQIVYASGSQPAQDPTGGWELEDSLDIEWAHAVAPKTKICLVEARRNTIAMARDNLALATDPSELPAFRWQTSPFKTTKLHFNRTY